jgi:signal transduction histidine kinase
LLETGLVVMNRHIRHRLLTVVLAGVLACALSVVALVQLLTTTTTQRTERGREAVIEEVDRLARDPAQLADPTPSSLISLRAGVWTGSDPPRALTPEWGERIRHVIEEARREGGRVIREAPVPQGTAVMAARPVASPEASKLATDAVVFGVYVVRPLPSLRTWQRIVLLLSGATVLLVATAIYSIVTMSRGAAALRSSLDALATNLRAPVPRPSVHELDGISDGIASLAQKLADARAKEEDLARELAQNERLAALGRVVAGVAHEVRNPLASIKLRLDLAAATSALPGPTEEAVGHAIREIERLDRLVADLLFVAGRAVGPKDKGDFGALVRARAEAVSAWASERGVVVEASGEGFASIDADAMARAVDNLLRNAVEASPRGERVVARVTLEAGRVILSVEDRGTGVPKDRAAELFEPFFTTKPGGTGLGLAISRAIARAHGGDVAYARDDDVTRFTLTAATSATDARSPKKEAA